MFLLIFQGLILVIVQQDLFKFCLVMLLVVLIQVGVGSDGVVLCQECDEESWLEEEYCCCQCCQGGEVYVWSDEGGEVLVDEVGESVQVDELLCKG